MSQLHNPKISKNALLIQFGLLFFLILTIPYDTQLFQSLTNGPFFAFENWFQLATYRTSFIPESSHVGSDVRGYYNWLIAFLAATLILIGLRKFFATRWHMNTDELYYWLRVLLRYRLALAVVFIGIVKVLPLQIPEPTISDLHTEYGDFLLWKLYYLTNGIATAGYLPVIGSLEILGGLLLLNRRTAVIGAGLLLAVLLNVVLVNYVYDIGEQVYSSLLFLMALVIFVYDWPRFYGLLIRKTQVYPDGYWPRFTQPVAVIRPYLQALILLIAAVFSVQAYLAWKDSNYPFPKENGIAGISGVYNVKDFVWKGDTLAYSLVDTIRWRDVVFEKWNTVSIRDNRPAAIDSTKARITFSTGRNYEHIGNAGRHFFTYKHSKNKKDSTISLRLVGKIDSAKTFRLSLNKLGSDTLLLRGASQAGDSLFVRLERIDKKYLLKEGRRKPIRIY